MKKLLAVLIILGLSIPGFVYAEQQKTFCPFGQHAATTVCSAQVSFLCMRGNKYVCMLRMEQCGICSTHSCECGYAQKWLRFAQGDSEYASHISLAERAVEYYCDAERLAQDPPPATIPPGGFTWPSLPGDDPPAVEPPVEPDPPVDPPVDPPTGDCSECREEIATCNDKLDRIKSIINE